MGKLSQALALGGDVLNHNVGAHDYGFGGEQPYDYDMLMNSGIYGPPGGMLDSLFGSGAEKPEQKQVWDEQMPESPQLPADPASAQENIAMAAFKPKKRSVLGTLGDFISVLGGGGMPFQAKIDEKNLMKAMDGFTDNPMEAVRRIAQIPGMQKQAMDLYLKMHDDERMQGNLDRQNRAFDSKYEEGVTGVVVNMMKAATPQTWTAMAGRAKQYWDNKMPGVPMPFDIPDTYDETADAGISYSRTSAKDQDKLEQADKRIEQGDKRIEETGRHNQATEGQAAVNEAGRNARNDTNEAGRNNRANQAEAGRNARDNGANRPRNVQTKYGIGQVNKDGTQMLLQRGGKYYLYLNGGKNQKGETNWVPQGEVKPKG